MILKFEADIIAPSVNHGYITLGRGKRCASPELKSYKKYIAALMRNAFIADNAKYFKGKKLILEMHFFRSDWMLKSRDEPRKIDVSNFIKFSEDAFMDGLGIDDRWIWKPIPEKHDVKTKEEHKTIWILREYNPSEAGSYEQRNN